MNKFELGMLLGTLLLIPIGLLYWFVGEKIDNFNSRRKND
jgi:hypothetical protein